MGLKTSEDLGKIYRVVSGPYKGKQGMFIGTMESDNEMALRSKEDDTIAFPYTEEVEEVFCE